MFRESNTNFSNILIQTKRKEKKKGERERKKKSGWEGVEELALASPGKEKRGNNVVKKGAREGKEDVKGKGRRKR